MSEASNGVHVHLWRRISATFSSRGEILSLIWKRRASLIAQFLKNPPARQETIVRFLGQDNPSEK